MTLNNKQFGHYDNSMVVLPSWPLCLQNMEFFFLNQMPGAKLSENQEWLNLYSENKMVSIPIDLTFSDKTIFEMPFIRRWF